LDFEDSINSNLIILLIFLLLSSFSLINLDKYRRKIFDEGKYLILLAFILDSEQQAEIICKSSGDWAIIFYK